MIFLSNIYLTVRYFYTLIYPSISSISLINLIAIKGNKSSTRYLQRFRNFLPRSLSTIHRFVHNLFLTSFALISSVFFSLSLLPSSPLRKISIINVLSCTFLPRKSHEKRYYPRTNVERYRFDAFLRTCFKYIPGRPHRRRLTGGRWEPLASHLCVKLTYYKSGR